MLKGLHAVPQPVTVPWASAASDAARLQALARRPDPTATLYAPSSASSSHPVLLCDRHSDLGRQFLAFGHARATAQDYTTLLEAVASLGLPAVRFAGLPGAAAAGARAVFAAADYRELYCTPCRQCRLSMQRVSADLAGYQTGDGLPEGFMVAQLRPEDAHVVNDRW